ncbi:RING-H2 finger protein ATL74-like [Malania oleifera]|uniref:RING-H2 finger protein ATL74-like n=1 Tax=Malania oleifera TaxID=397392 RepID=UPI0025AE0147|nr:RING-H2 finger protein ATL74-like [Malania oleifera]XP_057971136.1 RING-H2 finger protein ATL74-like [Malania oleifera]XP_057971137.1 RING-H2 finger protein ATL74-like [Malania oleifera]XP_057971138.1 RING-H2 finger protein ATL74-like [Malania oleifera]XP_057971139.1 RING-H2 finger protein ATL74-like [Malania oleifera]XP_057971141.1 RING-H2 finger protein ATL74-like [Malania oleifera]XP_057971142.1 RING-H2 finger protein ATL74-like [Malania oleifera]XP_057971143.1 RING-H2 finger protein A
MVNFPRSLLGEHLASAPANGNKMHDSDVSETNFDTNMVIILAALLCALIGALGLNSIVRCALRCGRRFTSQTPDQAAARAAATGLKKRALRRIPVAVYGSTGANFPATECPICLGEFEDGDKVRVLPKCNHGFHVRCIDTWLVSHSSCPNCRHSLLERPATADGANAAAGTPPPPPPPASGNGSGRRDSVAVVVVEAAS